MNSQQQKFSQGVQAVLATWPSFRSVISREASSNPIAENLVEAIIEYCHDCSISGHDDHDTLADSLAQLLADFMNDVFEIIIEDGSIEQRATLISRIYQEGFKSDQWKLVDELQVLASKAPKSSTPFQTKRNEDDNDSESDDDEDDEADGENMDVCDAAENNGTKETKKTNESNKRTEPVVDEEGFCMVQKGGRRR